MSVSPRTKQQDVYDSAIKEEFVKTMQVFDEFVEQFERLRPRTDYIQKPNLPIRPSKGKLIAHGGVSVRSKEYGFDDLSKLK